MHCDSLKSLLSELLCNHVANVPGWTRRTRRNGNDRHSWSLRTAWGAWPRWIIGLEGREGTELLNCWVRSTLLRPILYLTDMIQTFTPPVVKEVEFWKERNIFCLFQDTIYCRINNIFGLGLYGWSFCIQKQMRKNTASLSLFSGWCLYKLSSEYCGGWWCSCTRTQRRERRPWSSRRRKTWQKCNEIMYLYLFIYLISVLWEWLMII